MKKFILPMLALTMIFSSCEDDDKDKIQVKQTNLVMNFGDKIQIEAISPTRIYYISLEEFHAEVDKTGVITAGRIGQTEVVLINDKGDKRINVTVEPVHHLYDDPILEFGISREEIIKKLGKPDDEDNLFLFYETPNDGVLIAYYIENNKLRNVLVGVASGLMETFLGHLAERYNLYDGNEYSLWFCNTYDPNESTVEVEFYQPSRDVYMAEYSSTLPVTSAVKNAKTQTSLRETVQKLKPMELKDEPSGSLKSMMMISR